LAQVAVRRLRQRLVLTLLEETQMKHLMLSDQWVQVELALDWEQHLLYPREHQKMLELQQVQHQRVHRALWLRQVLRALRQSQLECWLCQAREPFDQLVIQHP
jgi:hypothetical protein